MYIIIVLGSFTLGERTGSIT